MKTKQTILAVIIVLAVITFVAIAMPSLVHNIVNDLIAKR